jgi:hypothetical protein
MGNLVDKAEHGAADGLRLLRVGIKVDVLDFAYARDLISCFLRDQPDFGLGAGKCRLAIKIFLSAERVRPVIE